MKNKQDASIIEFATWMITLCVFFAAFIIGASIEHYVPEILSWLW